MKRDADWFEGREPELIYIAKKLSDATALEAVLTEAGIDFGVEADEYQGGVIFRRTRIGAFFYVLPEARESTVALMRAQGYRLFPASGSGSSNLE
jgi:hypothetical protein